MKILAVTNMYPTCSHPGSGTFVEQQVAGLRKIGVNVEVLFIQRQSKGMKEYVRVPSLVRRAVAAFNPDVVHAMYGGVLADLTTSVVRDRPTVVTYHGSDLLGEHLSGVLRRCLAAYGVRSSHRAARRASGIVFVAEKLLEQVQVDSSRTQVRVIPCGIDFNRFRPMDKAACRRQLGWRSDRFQVLFNVSGGDPVKRPGLARRAVAELASRGVPADIHEMTGVTNEEVPVWLNASDVLLLTSLHEGSPTVVKEALACNVPVVSVDVGDVRERIRGIEGCYLASPEPADLAGKLNLVYERVGEVHSREKIGELSLECVASRLATFYRELTGTPAAEVHTMAPERLKRTV
jgi:teichuronic acid biosynthesis glycosyltransferase TuaC